MSDFTEQFRLMFEQFRAQYDDYQNDHARGLLCEKFLSEVEALSNKFMPLLADDVVQEDRAFDQRTGNL